MIDCGDGVMECGDMSPLSSTRYVASHQSANVSAHSKNEGDDVRIVILKNPPS
jgi:hypothetical protein